MGLKFPQELWIKPTGESWKLAEARGCFENLSKPIYIFKKNTDTYVSHAGEPSFVRENQDFFPLLALDTPLDISCFSTGNFLSEHNLKYPYLAGGMAHGISSVEMVVNLGRAGFMGFFGTGGLSLEEIEKAVIQIQGELSQDEPYGFNIISFDPRYDQVVIDLLLKYKVRRIEVGGAITITPALVEYRLKGAQRGDNNRVITPNKIFAKVSREEIASLFMSPPPERIISQLLKEGKITDKEAEIGREIPTAEDIIAEADSGGHTDNRPALVLFQNMINLRDQLVPKYDYKNINIRIGAAGGICTPHTILAAFTLGVDFVLTGSINQSCVEAGTSEIVKEMLAQVTMSDVSNAPSPDMFEIGSQVQVLSKGVMFHIKARKIYELYQTYNSIEEIPANIITQLEEKYFRESLAGVWEKTKEYFLKIDPSILVRAEKSPKFKMALIFRRYLGLAAKWAQDGVLDRKVDFQIYCGPSLGAFNRWIKGSYLEFPKNRRVADVARNLMEASMYLKRILYIREQGVLLPRLITQVAPKQE